MRRAGKIALWVPALLAVIVIALAIFIAFFDWNRARPWVDDKVTQAIGRPFAINGDLRVNWRRPSGETGWRAWVPWPHFSAADITVGNPPWAKGRYFATLDEIDFDVAVLPLLDHKIVVPSIRLVNPSVDLERMQDGRNNWTFALPASSGPSQWKLDLHDIAFARGYAALDDAQKKVVVRVSIDTLGHPIPFGQVLQQQAHASGQESSSMIGRSGGKQLEARALAGRASAASTAGAAASGAASVPGAASAQPGYAIGWTVKGTYNGALVDGQGKLGGILSLQDASRPFPLQADVRLGDTRIAVVGTLTDPLHLAALDLRLWLAGTSMSHLYPYTGLALPDTPPYATEGRLVGQLRSSGNIFHYENFTGRVGGSDLSGTLSYEARQPRALLSGTLVSNLLRFSDLAPLIGADSQANKAKRGDTVRQPAGRVLPVEQFRTDRWRTIDADVTFTGRHIVRQGDLPISNLSTHVTLNDGALTLDPLSLGVAGGTLTSNIHLNGRGTPMRGRFALKAQHLKLEQLFPGFAPMQTSLGEINGDAALSATGNSPAALAASSNGEVKLLIDHGAMSRALLEEAGLNVANIVMGKLFGDKDVEINCAAADFVVTNGVLDSRVFALDTQDALITVDGNIDLRDEQMNLNVRPHTKGFRVFSLRSPLYVKGTFKQPKVGVNVGVLALRGGAAVGLGLVAPVAALIPLLVPSSHQQSPCGSLIAQMRKAPAAPAPGHQEKVPAHKTGSMQAPHPSSSRSATERDASPGAATPGFEPMFKKP